ncbi:MAG: histidine phosphatase family protein [Pseudomonadota bacterium]|nr:histidine phosphatase family protein [Pseudomonadota bacterium]
MQRPTRVIAVRHGETAWNAETRMQGQLDVPLNDVGRWQARRTGSALADEEIDALYSSDLARALQTAEPIAQACGQAVVADAGLRERCFGVFQGLTFGEIEARWPEDSRRWREREPDFAPAGAETLNRFFARCIAAATRLVAAHPGQTIVLVAHGGVMDCLYRAATRIELQAPRSWLLGNASINRLLYTPQGFSLVGWSDTGHLEAEPLDEADEGEVPPPVADRMGYAA